MNANTGDSHTVSRPHDPRRVDPALQEQLARTVDQCPVAVVITDTKGTIEYVNPWFETVTGYTAAEAIGANPRVLKSGEQPAEFYRELWTALNAGREWTGEFHNRRKDGSLFWERAVISPLRNDRGEITHFVAVKEDVTQRKRDAEALVAARDEAERANRAKSVFLANMSHELRTPLNVINGLAATLLEQELGPETRPLVQLISQSGGTLLGIIEEVLEFAKVQAGRQHVEMEDSSLSEIVARSLDIAQEMARGRPVTVSIAVGAGVPSRMGIDARRLQQILVNLLGNAVKFTEVGSVTLVVETRAAADGRRRLSLAVYDSGPGIAPDVLATLFQPFQQGDDSITRRFGGSGLGLVVSRSFAQLMGGDVVARSVPGRGSVFTVELPLTSCSGDLAADLGWSAEMTGRFIPWAEAAARRARPSPGPHKTQSLGQRLPLRILAADDVATNRQVLQVIFRHLGYSPIIVADGAQALAAAQAHPFDLILLDVQMPEMDGPTAAREIRAFFSGSTARPRIVALTANATEEGRRACLEAGMDDFLTKPVVPRQIEDCFVRLFQQGPGRTSVSTPSVPSVDALPYVDETHLAAIADGMPPGLAGEMLLQLAVTFGTDFSSALTRMEDACGRRDDAAVAALLHALKGGSAMMGWAQFGALCRKEMDALQAGTFTGWDDLPERLRQMHRQSAVVFEQFLARAGGLVGVEAPT